MHIKHTFAALAAVVALAAPLSAQAQDIVLAAAETPDATTVEATRGPVTGLPLPRYVSMKASEGFARRGPSSTHRIDWVFKRRHMPLRVVGEYGHWRRVQDREGAGGWMHYTLLSGNRTVIVDSDDLHLRRKPDLGAGVSARLQSGVVAWLGQCDANWCSVTVDGVDGWAQTSALWGVAPGETRE